MNINEIRERFASDELTWADLLVITGLPAHILYGILFDQSKDGGAEL